MIISRDWLLIDDRHLVFQLYSNGTGREGILPFQKGVRAKAALTLPLAGRWHHVATDSIDKSTSVMFATIDDI